MQTEELGQLISGMAHKAKMASSSLMATPSKIKDQTLLKVAELLIERKAEIQVENKKDLIAGKEKGLSDAMLDRLELSDAVIESMVIGLQEVVALPDPVGEVTEMTKRPNELMVGRMRVPLGVIGMIYESRPNVTIDAAALCLKTGNAILLRGGSEAIHSNLILSQILRQALEELQLPGDAVQVIPVTDREAIQHLIQQEEMIDLIIPRGGEGLIRFVAENSRIPVLKHYKGVCHIFVDKMADVEKALPLIVNSKTHRTGVCNALEGLLIHQDIADEFIVKITDALVAKDVELYGCEKCIGNDNRIASAEGLWGTEFLDLKLCMKVVAGYQEAKEYIQQYGSKHTEVIITEDYSLAQRFIQEVDASAVMVNASTRFNDGGQLGLGTEIGISTTKLHAYGPMGLKELTTRKFVVYGQGQTRV